MTFFRLQSLTLPDADLAAPEDLYLRHVQSGVASASGEGAIILDSNQCITTDTFFNALTVDIWKTHSRIETVVLFLEGEGRVRIRFGLHGPDGEHQWLQESTCDLLPGQPTGIDMPFWKELRSGLLYCELAGQAGRTRITDGWYATKDRPLRDVRLGIVITHFNRPQHVIPAARRIQQQLLADADYRGSVELVIVDNSRQLNAADVPGATLIPNRNLGGSGGFMRGLLYLEDADSFTHCLFMDDDAACEVESIRRTFAMLSYCTTPGLAVSGALLSQTEPFRLIEKGATFNSHCSPLNAGLDMRDIPDLLLADQAGIQPDYGAWWFFAFPLEYVKNYTFPFFLRGDDVQFSLANKFHIITMNGVTCWSDDFSIKENPFYNYFDSKHHLIHALLEDGDTRSIRRMVKGFFRGKLKAYCYDAAAAVSLSLEHVSKGPSFWVEDSDLSKVRAELAALSASQRPVAIITEGLKLVKRKKASDRWVRALRFFTYNGLFLPKFLLRRNAVYQNSRYSAQTDAIFGFCRIFYVDEMTGTGFQVEHNSIRAWRELYLFRKRLKYFERNFDDLRASYRNAQPEMTSRQFWRRIFSDHAAG